MTYPRNVSRRSLLASSIALAAALAARPVRAAQRAPRLWTPDFPISQGGCFIAVVEGDGISSVTVWFAGRAYPAVADGGGWLAVIGVGQRAGLTDQHPPGGYDVVAAVTLAAGGTRTLAGSVRVVSAEFPVEAIWLDAATSALLDPALVEREITALRDVLAGLTPRRLWDGFFLRPTSGPITDVFGSRRSYNGGPATGSHSGVDFGADMGAPVRAAAAGRVAFAGPLPVRGSAVYLDHGAGLFTGYCHLSRIAATAGQELRAGDSIGAAGSSGLATGPHLHWEVAANGYHVNGLGWLLPE